VRSHTRQHCGRLLTFFPGSENVAQRSASSQAGSPHACGPAIPTSALGHCGRSAQGPLTASSIKIDDRPLDRRQFL